MLKPQLVLHQPNKHLRNIPGEKQFFNCQKHACALSHV